MMQSGRGLSPSVVRRTLHRRGFIHRFALFAASSWVAGEELTAWLVAKVSAQASSEIGIFRLSLATFTALRTDFGSIRVRVTGMPASFPQIIVTRTPGNQFFAVSSVCTHQASIVDPYSRSLNSLRCPAHGSRFSPDGAVLAGPATSALPRFRTTFDGNNMVAVEIPGLGFSARIVAVTNPGAENGRVRIEFPTVSGVRYQLQFRPSLADGNWTQIPFATTPDGALSLTQLTGNNTKATVYVEGKNQFGFFAVVRL
jgi:nitrite reductase/ring-hydroxylating ferredoxin subunit